MPDVAVWQAEQVAGDACRRREVYQSQQWRLRQVVWLNQLQQHDNALFIAPDGLASNSRPSFSWTLIFCA